MYTHSRTRQLQPTFKNTLNFSAEKEIPSLMQNTRKQKAPDICWTEETTLKKIYVGISGEKKTINTGWLGVELNVLLINFHLYCANCLLTLGSCRQRIINWRHFILSAQFPLFKGDRSFPPQVPLAGDRFALCTVEIHTNAKSIYWAEYWY